MSSQAKEAMLESTVLLLRERGLTGTSVRDVVEHSGAPRGSVYHHFPGGKTQMVDEAVARAGTAISAAIDHYQVDGDPLAALDGLVDFFVVLLESSDYNAGCPVAAVAGEADSSEGRAQSAAAGRVFGQWSKQLADTASARGVARERAERLANLMIASLEGALLMARATRSTKPILDVAAELRPMLEKELT